MSDRDGYDRLNDRFERSAGQLADRPGRTSLKWLLGIAVGFALIGIVAGIVGFIGDWGNEAKRIASPTNVKVQHTAIIEDWEAMVAAAGNACTVGDPKRSADDPVLVEDPAAAYKATFRNLRADYGRRWNNLFEAKAVGPPGYPRPDQFPELGDIDSPKADWCGIAAKLRKAHS